MSGIGAVKVKKARFEIFYFYFLLNFNFTFILGGKGSRGLWDDGHQVFGNYFIHLVNDEVNSGLNSFLSKHLNILTSPRIL